MIVAMASNLGSLEEGGEEEEERGRPQQRREEEQGKTVGEGAVVEGGGGISRVDPILQEEQKEEERCNCSRGKPEEQEGADMMGVRHSLSFNTDIQVSKSTYLHSTYIVQLGLYYVDLWAKLCKTAQLGEMT